MTIAVGAGERRFAILSMSRLPKNVNRQILRNAISDLSCLIVLTYAVLWMSD